MISLSLAAGLAALILSTSFISGIFGMAGGMILMAILLAVMPVAAAMVLHGVTQMASNGWRAWMWRGYIRWSVVAWYAGGAIIAGAAFAAAGIVPSKPVSLIILGSMALAGLCIPKAFAPNIMRPRDAIGCGTLCTTFQLMAGVSGPIFDVFFVRSQLDRKGIVATKAAIQALGHLLKVAYFGQILAGTPEIPPAALALAVAFALIGTQLSRSVLDAMSDVQFIRWTRGLIAVVAAVCIIRGIAIW
jgi:uncharacterized membrane protein YfcA